MRYRIDRDAPIIVLEVELIGKKGRCSVNRSMIDGLLGLSFLKKFVLNINFKMGIMEIKKSKRKWV